jgi:acetyl/propionyl-CoA carboxylase alpha subunit
VFDCDLVQLQLRLASGISLSDLRLDKVAAAGPRGYALEARLNAERFQPDGTVLPSAGTVSRLTVPAAPDIRFDSCAYAGYPVSTRYDSLLAKCIVRGETPAGVIARAAEVTGQIQVDGVDTNAAFLSRLLAHSDVRTGSFGITFIQDNAAALTDPPGRRHPPSRTRRTTRSWRRPLASSCRSRSRARWSTRAAKRRSSRR